MHRHTVAMLVKPLVAAMVILAERSLPFFIWQLIHLLDTIFTTAFSQISSWLSRKQWSLLFNSTHRSRAQHRLRLYPHDMDVVIWPSVPYVYLPSRAAAVPEMPLRYRFMIKCCSCSAITRETVRHVNPFAMLQVLLLLGAGRVTTSNVLH